MGRIESLTEVSAEIEESINEFKALDLGQRKHSLNRRIKRVDDLLDKVMSDVLDEEELTGMKTLTKFIFTYMTLSSSLKISSSSILHDLIESQTQEAVIDLRSKIDEIMDSLGRDLFSEI